uniref:Uncharacterized protein LOC114342564 n=1 Tax=Diabrotica virgifera virgifera TaxID=50390 RepID=A0A6P7GZG8_DIAVI
MFAGNIIPTLNQILAELKSKNIINCCKSTLRKFLLSNGFKYKTINKRHTIMESARLIKWRNEYLEKITEYRNSGRKIYYLDETWFDTNETIGKGWSNDNVKCKVNVPPSRGKRICILHCGGEDGWVTDSLLLSAKDIKDSCLDYHQDITGELFESWFKNNLLPNLADNSVIVLDNASYHSRQLKKIPNKYSRKDELQDFLLSQDLYFEDWYTKDQLVEVLNTKLFVKEYIIDNAASKNGHTTLRLPPYYCVLNPIELLWSQLKYNVRQKNVSPKCYNTVVKLIDSEFKNISEDNWKKAIEHVKNIEKEYLKNIPVINKIIINVENSDSEEESDEV